MLDDRKMRVLHAIVNSYIISAEPIGSRTISKKYDLGVSSATIRNEMSDLEDLGYLNKPYTSAGRVPSDKAYRLYVDTLMESLQNKIDHKKKDEMKKILLKEAGEIDQLIQNSAKILSKITNYTAVAAAPQLRKSALKRLYLIPIDEVRMLAVIISDSGIIKNTIFRMDTSISEDQLLTISNFLNEKLKGMTIEEISKGLDTTILEEMYEFKNIINNIIPIVNQSLDDIENVEVYADGVTNIFDFPEYKDVSKAKTFISFIEDKQSIIDILLKDTIDDIEIFIGDENPHEELRECSLITATYKLDGQTIGKIGVIGPTRMNYIKVINAVRLLSINLNEIMDKYFAE